MLRGSRPGERRGGRKRHTPNRRTILTERILVVGSDHPTVSRRGFLHKLIKDRKLPADTRMAVAPKCFPAKRTRSGASRRSRVSADIRSKIEQGTAAERGSVAAFVAAFDDPQAPALAPAGQDWNPQALDALFGIVQDAAADPKARRKAALKIAEFLLPKSGKKAKAVADDYGFTINPNLASEYRNIQLEVRSLAKQPTRVLPAVALRIQKLRARSDAVLRRLQCPCPTKYGNREAAKDFNRLIEFIKWRDDKTALTEVQDAEEAHLRARYDTFATSPEAMARRRRSALQDAERLFKKSLLTGDLHAPPLSRKDQSDLELLRWLYPESKSKFSYRDQDKQDDWDVEMFRDHPFQFVLPASDGNLYPRDSKVRPVSASAADDRLVAAMDGPSISPVCPNTAPTTD